MVKDQAERQAKVSEKFGDAVLEETLNANTSSSPTNLMLRRIGSACE